MNRTQTADELESLAERIRTGKPEDPKFHADAIYRKQRILQIETTIDNRVIGEHEVRRIVERQMASRFADEMVKDVDFDMAADFDPTSYYSSRYQTKLRSKMFCFTPTRLRDLIDECIRAGQRCA